MIELSISDAQAQFTKLFSEIVTIVDKKSHKKRAVMLPYDVYEKLLQTQQKEKVFRSDAELDSFLGLLEGKQYDDSDDARYTAIVK